MENSLEKRELLEFDYSVLIVENNRKRALNLKYILDGLYNTYVVRNIEEAKDFLKTKLPDIIITNYSFVKDGGLIYQNETNLTALDLSKFIHKSEDIVISAIPIIVIIEQNNPKLIAQLLHDGINDVIKYPYDILELLSRIETQVLALNEKKKLIGSLQEMMEDSRIRTRKNIDFRTKILAKHHETTLAYEDKIKQMAEDIFKLDTEIHKLRLDNSSCQAENIKLLNEISVLKSKSEVKNTQTQQPKPTTNQTATKKVEQEQPQQSIEDLAEEDINQIEYLVKYINSEFLFEDNSIKYISDRILEANDIDFKKIDNFSFIFNIQKIIRKWIKIDLESFRDKCQNNGYLTRCKRYFEPTIDFLLKNYINKFLFFMSINLLERIGEKNENATKFLKFYDGKIEIALNGVRYQKPLVGSDDKDNSWNMISIIQIINQRANGHKLLVEQLAIIQKINTDIDEIKKQFDSFLSADGLLNEELKKQRPLEEKFDLVDNLLQDEMRKSRDYTKTQDLETKAKQLSKLKEAYLKLKTTKDTLSSKYTKQVAYYKPTEEKFEKVALSVAKVMLKVKVIS